MSTIAVVKKDGRVAIAADTLTKWGGTRESARYIVNHSKIVTIGDSHIAITGSTAGKLMLEDYFASLKKPPALGSVPEIFQTWLALHAAMKSRYFLNPTEDDGDTVESTRFDVLIANPAGIFGVSGHRVVQEFARYYAYGSGAEYATGALFAAYDDPGRTAEELARLGVEAAAEFDDATGLPVISYTVLQVVDDIGTTEQVRHRRGRINRDV